MENYLSTFSYVKILKAEADKAGLFAEGMRCNYELESELTEQHLKYIGAAYWMDRAPEIVDKLDVGNVFVGVSKQILKLASTSLWLKIRKATVCGSHLKAKRMLNLLSLFGSMIRIARISNLNSELKKVKFWICSNFVVRKAVST